MKKRAMRNRSPSMQQVIAITAVRSCAVRIRCGAVRVVRVVRRGVYDSAARGAYGAARGECGAARCVWCSAVRVVSCGAVRRGAQRSRCRPRHTSSKISMNHEAIDQPVEQRINTN